MDKDFLLETETAKKLFHDYAEKTPLPITRSSANGLSAWARLSATRSSTGAIWNYRDTSVTTAF